MDDSCEELEAEAEYYANKDWYSPKPKREYKPRNKKRIGIVCSEEQYKMIKRLALENDTNMSDYILMKLFGKNTKVKKHIDWEEEPPIDFYDDGEF
jgi:hypothetical protein